MKRYALPPPSGGMNTTASPDIIKDDQCVMAYNTLSCLSGQRPLGAFVEHIGAQPSSGTATNVFYYSPAGEEHKLCVVASDMNYWSGSAWVDITQSADKAVNGNWTSPLGRPVCSVMYGDRLFVAIPGQRPYIVEHVDYGGGTIPDAIKAFPAGKIPYQCAGGSELPRIEIGANGKVLDGTYQIASYAQGGSYLARPFVDVNKSGGNSDQFAFSMGVSAAVVSVDGSTTAASGTHTAVPFFNGGVIQLTGVSGLISDVAVKSAGKGYTTITDVDYTTNYEHDLTGLELDISLTAVEAAIICQGIGITDGFYTDVRCTGGKPYGTAWDSRTSYTVGNVVVDPTDYQLYACTLNITSPGTEPHSDPSHWEVDTDNANYALANVVAHDGKLVYVEIASGKGGRYFEAPTGLDIASGSDYVVSFSMGLSSDISVTNGAVPTGDVLNLFEQPVRGGGGGTGAECSITILAGKVLGVEITNPGSGYLSCPEVDVKGHAALYDLTTTFGPALKTLSLAVTGGDVTTYDESPIVNVIGGSGATYMQAFPHVRSGTTGPLNGNYEYAFAYRVKDTEGNLIYESDLSIPFKAPTVKNGFVYLTNISFTRVPAHGFNAGKRDVHLYPRANTLVIYRRGGSAPQGFAAVAELPVTGPQDNIASWIDSVAESDMGFIADDYGSHETPPPCRYLAVYHERMVYANTYDHPDELLISHLRQPECVNRDPNPVVSTYGIQFQMLREPGAEITGMCNCGSALGVWTSTGHYTITGTNPTNFVMNRESSYGCVAHGSAVTVGNGAIWLSRDGFVYWEPGGQVQRIGLPIKSITDAFVPEYFNALYAQALVIPGYYIFVYNASHEAESSAVLAYSLDTGGWSMIENGRWDCCAASVYEADQDMVLVSYNNPGPDEATGAVIGYKHDVASNKDCYVIYKEFNWGSGAHVEGIGKMKHITRVGVSFDEAHPLSATSVSIDVNGHVSSAVVTGGYLSRRFRVGGQMIKVKVTRTNNCGSIFQGIDCDMNYGRLA